MKLLGWFAVLAGVAGLVGVRIVEDRLFYDPFLQYFHLADKDSAFPNFNWVRLIGSYLLRFILNLGFSVLIIHFLFKNLSWTLQAATMIVLVFLITFPIYLYCISTEFRIGYLFSFYIRRFVIQPLVVLLIIPIFYYRIKISGRHSY